MILLYAIFNIAYSNIICQYLNEANLFMVHRKPRLGGIIKNKQPSISISEQEMVF